MLTISQLHAASGGFYGASLPLSALAEWHGSHHDVDWYDHVHSPHLGLHASRLWQVSAPCGTTRRFISHVMVAVLRQSLTSPALAAGMR